MTTDPAYYEENYGAPEAPNLVAPFHDHYFNFRLDFDVDGRSTTPPSSRWWPANDSPRRSFWRVERSAQASDLKARYTLSAMVPKYYLVANQAERTRLGHHPAYLVPGDTGGALSKGNHAGTGSRHIGRRGAPHGIRGPRQRHPLRSRVRGRSSELGAPGPAVLPKSLLHHLCGPGLPAVAGADAGAYSQQHAVNDAVAVLDGLGVEAADVVGISMGGFAGLHLAMRHPARVRSLVVLGTGYGARPAEAQRFRDECEAIARLIQQSGMAPFARRYLSGPARVQFQNKDPRGWEQLVREAGWGSTTGRSGSHDARAGSGSGRRLYSPGSRAHGHRSAGADWTSSAPETEDDGCLETSLWLKRVIPRSGLAVPAEVRAIR